MIDENTSLDRLNQQENEVWFPTKPIPNCTERESPIYLTREDIRDLGFLRSNPEKKIYKHIEKQDLYLLQQTHYNLLVKDFAEETIEIWSHKILGNIPQLLYQSTKPNKEEIQSIIDNYI